MSGEKRELSAFEPEKSSDESSADYAGALFDTAVFAFDFTNGVRRFWYILLILAIIFGGAGAAFKYKTYVPMYESSVSFSVTSQSYATGLASAVSYYDNASAQQLSASFPYIVSTAMMTNALEEKLGTGYVNGKITASPVISDTNIFKVNVTSNSAQDAYDIINAVVEVYPDVARYVVGNVELNILIKPTVPTAPYTSNNVVRAAALFAAVGVGLGCGVIALFALFRRTVRKKDDFKSKLNQTCLVELPYVVPHRRTGDKSAGEKLIRITDKVPMLKESYRLLRKRLARHLDKNEKVIAVVAAARNEGKTSVAVNLAHSFALAQNRVAVVDLDLRRRPLQHYFPPESEDFKGFTELIAASSDDFDSISVKDSEHLYFFYAGKEPLSLNERLFESFFKYLRANFDYVFVNTSAGAAVGDVVSACNLCDCIVGVVRQDTVSLDRIRKTLEYLSYSTAKIKGFVFNAVREGFSGYGGYYYSGRYGYGRYGYGKYGYGKYGYGKYGYGYGKYGYGYGEEESEDSDSSKKHSKRRSSHRKKDAAAVNNDEEFENGEFEDISDVNADAASTSEKRKKRTGHSNIPDAFDGE